MSTERRLQWKIYYDDGSTWDHTMLDPDHPEWSAEEAAPSYGFICALGYDEGNKRYIMHGWDHYHYDKETLQWWGMDREGLTDRLCRNLVYAYKLGRTVSKTRFYELMDLAHRDPDYPMD